MFTQNLTNYKSDLQSVGIITTNHFQIMIVMFNKIFTQSITLEQICYKAKH